MAKPDRRTLARAFARLPAAVWLGAGTGRPFAIDLPDTI
jgi:hypothetical protein